MEETRRGFYLLKLSCFPVPGEEGGRVVGRGGAGFAVFVVNVLVVTAFKSLEKIPT